ncbi:MAG: hypothetical protein R6V17_03540 [Halanaerobacter sp.]
MNQDKLEELIKKQKRLNQDYQSLFNAYDVKDLIRENEELKQELRSYKRELDDLEEHLYNLRDRNKRLRSAMEKKIIDERMELIKISRKKLELYFSARANDYKDRLTALEDEVKNKLVKLKKKVEASLSNDQEDLLTDLEELSSKLDKRIQYRKEQFEEERREIKEYYEEGQEELSQREVAEKDMEKRIEENDLREKKGLEWIKKLGVIAVILSLGAIGRYIYLQWGNQYFKMIFLYLTGITSLGLGEFVFTKNHLQKRRLSRLLLISGLCTLYFANFRWTGNNFIVVTIITLGALYLVKKYYSQSLFITALLGGYSPLFIKLIAEVYNNAQLTLLNINLGIFYTIFNFLLFSWVILYILSYYHSFFQLINQVLFSINNLFSFVLLYWFLSNSFLKSYLGLLPIVFIVFYFFLKDRLNLDKYKNLEWQFFFKRLNTVFFILIPVLQFEIQWWVLAWLVEGLLIIAYLFLWQKRRVIRYSKEYELINYFKYFALVGTWTYLIYFSFRFENYSFILVIAINFILAYLLQNVELLNDKVVDYMAIFFYSIGNLLSIYITLQARRVFSNFAVDSPLFWIVLFVINLLLLVNLRKLIITFLERYKYNLEIYPLSLGGLSLIYLTAILVFQFGLKSNSLILTAFYFLVALFYIAYGLYRKFIYARLAGLFILILVMAKLFVYDLSFLGGIMRLLSYLGLSIFILVIYFSYQKLKDKIGS